MTAFGGLPSGSMNSGGWMSNASASRTNRLNSAPSQPPPRSIVAPANVAQPLDLLVRDLVGVPRQRLNELQQKPLGRRHVRFIEIALA